MMANMFTLLGGPAVNSSSLRGTWMLSLLNKST